MLQARLRKMGAAFLTVCMACGSLQTMPFHVAAAETASSIAASITEAELNADATALNMPEVPGGMSVRFCADYEQVIGEDGTVYQPLEDKVVKGFFEVVSGEEKGKTDEFTVTVPGVYADGGENEKPTVVPQLQEWHGDSGVFFFRSTSRIVADAQLQDAAEQFAEDLEDITGKRLHVVIGDEYEAGKGDFFLTLETEDEGLGDEGYLMEVGDTLKIEAKTETGVYWGTISVLQILKQTGNYVSKGTARDYPKYKVRAFMLDVGRKPFTLDTVKEYAKNMSWYKMNNFQLHLNDNLIFLETYATMQEAIDNAYAAFRLESDVVNEETGESLTAKDLYYTKDEFRSFIQDSRKIGIDVVPEFDMPAHALAITRVFQDIMSKKNGGSHAYLIEEMDLSKPEATELAKKIWEDYLDGDDPVFDEETTVHIGTDEFHGTGGNEAFRKFSDDMIAFIQSKGRTVRMWGSLSNKSGTTPVRSKDVQLNIWATNYANPQAMYNQGFDMINTLAQQGGGYGLYIVPSGTNSDKGTYSDYLDAQRIYESWTPNKFDSYTLKAGDDQMLGGCYAEWHDNIDTYQNGLSEYDSFDRFFRALPSVASKLWTDPEKGYSEFAADAQRAGTAPGTNPYYKVESKTATVLEYTFDGTLEEDASGNGYDVTEAKNASQETVDGASVLKLNGQESWIKTPVDKIGPDNCLMMRVKMEAGASGEQILCESWQPFGETYGTYAVKAVQKETGKVGFSREGTDYSFDYTLTPGVWTDLMIKGHQNTAELYVNGTLADTLTQDNAVKNKNIKWVNTLVLPVGRIGSTTHSFQGLIDYVKAGTGDLDLGDSDASAIPQAEMTATVCSAAKTQGNEGPAEYAIDGNPDTYWHSDWASDTAVSEEHPHWIKLTFKNNKAYQVDRLTCLPPQNKENGRILSYAVEAEQKDGTVVEVARGAWENDESLKEAVFTQTVDARSITLKILDCPADNVGKHAMAAEINVYRAAADLQEVLKEWEAVLTQEFQYTAESWAEFKKEYDAAEKAQNDSSLGKEERQKIAAALRAAAERLKKIPASEVIAEQIVELEKVNGKGADQSLIQKLEQAKRELEALIGQGSAQEQLAAAIEKAAWARAAVELSKEINEGAEVAGMTKDSVDAYDKALQAAKEILGKSAAAVKEMEEARGALKAAKENLKKETIVVKPPMPEEKPAPVGTLKEEGGITVKVTKSDASKGTVSITKVNKKLKKAVIPDSVRIGKYSFQVTAVDAKAFQGCRKLASVAVGVNVANIGKQAFAKCGKLKKIVFKGKKAPKIGKQAFKGTAAKCKVTAPKKMTKKQFKQLKSRMKSAGMSKKAVYKK